MNTSQLEHVFSSEPEIKKTFGGVYACDQLPTVSVNHYPASFIVSTDPKSLPGTHWIAIYLEDEEHGEFFDSYGQHPTDYNDYFVNFMNKHTTEWKHNENGLQSAFSNVCGQYCIYYLYYRSRGIPMSSIVNRFSLNRSLNDLFVYNFVKNRFKKAHPSVKQEMNFVFTQICRALYKNKT